MCDAPLPISVQPADFGHHGGFDIGHGGQPAPRAGFQSIRVATDPARSCAPSTPPCRPRRLCHKRAMSQVFALPGFDLDAFVAATLAEDLGDKGDITSAAVIPADAVFAGVM